MTFTLAKWQRVPTATLAAAFVNEHQPSEISETARSYMNHFSDSNVKKRNVIQNLIIIFCRIHQTEMVLRQDNCTVMVPYSSSFILSIFVREVIPFSTTLAVFNYPCGVCDKPQRFIYFYILLMRRKLFVLLISQKLQHPSK